jgi:putative ABC transport system permease protein
MREGCTTATGVRGPRVRRTLVIVETALAVVLLSGAGVLMRALITMRSTQPGFDTRNMVAAEIWLPPARFSRVPDRVQLFDGILTRVRALPAVRGAAFIANLPLNGSGDSQGFLIVGQDLPPGKFFSSGFNIATPGYFQMMGIPILEGRGFADADRGDAPGVLVINRAAARRFWPDQPAIGRQIRLPIAGRQPVLLTVVGVAADVGRSDLVQPPQPEIYLSAMQSELSWSSTVLAVRTIGAPGQLIEPIRAVVRDVNAAVPIYRINMMEDVVARSLAEPRLYSWLFTAFSAAAVALAAIGLYGLVSFSVTQRSKELSVRVALGASRFEIISMVLRQGLGLASLGAAIGLAGGVAVTRSLGSVVRGLEPGDPITFVAVTGVLLTAAAIACYLPARRAARLDPLAALRSQ